MVPGGGGGGGNGGGGGDGGGGGGDLRLNCESYFQSSFNRSNCAIALL